MMAAGGVEARTVAGPATPAAARNISIAAVLTDVARSLASLLPQLPPAANSAIECAPATMSARASLHVLSSGLATSPPHHISSGSMLACSLSSCVHLPQCFLPMSARAVCLPARCHRVRIHFVMFPSIYLPSRHRKSASRCTKCKASGRARSSTVDCNYSPSKCNSDAHDQLTASVMPATAVMCTCHVAQASKA